MRSSGCSSAILNKQQTIVALAHIIARELIHNRDHNVGIDCSAKHRAQRVCEHLRERLAIAFVSNSKASSSVAHALNIEAAVFLERAQLVPQLDKDHNSNGNERLRTSSTNSSTLFRLFQSSDRNSEFKMSGNTSDLGCLIQRTTSAQCLIGLPPANAVSSRRSCAMSSFEFAAAVRKSDDGMQQEKANLTLQRLANDGREIFV